MEAAGKKDQWEGNERGGLMESVRPLREEELSYLMWKRHGCMKTGKTGDTLCIRRLTDEESNRRMVRKVRLYGHEVS